jgi:transketolase
VINPVVTSTIGGSADLTGSNNTKSKDLVPLTAEDYAGRYIYYGIREFGMAAAMNGMALHGGVIPYGGTFLVFTDYARPAIRLSALQNARVIYVMTHDSIGLGEDGPTHQPIEQLTSLRSTPNLDTWRPADAVESAVAWKHAIERNDGPSALIFSRQNLPHQARDALQLENINRGGYVLRDCNGEPDLILIATGSEVGLAVQAFDKLTAEGKNVRVVSMPCTSVFESQDALYKQSVLPLEVSARIAIEAGHADYWYKYVGLEGRVIGMTTFGESAPANLLFEEFGFTLENIISTAEELLED